jgi:hypothetical protein
MRRRAFLQLGAGFAAAPSSLFASPLHGSAGALTGLDLRDSVVLLRRDASVREKKAAQVLVEEAEKRCDLSWPVASEGALHSSSAVQIRLSVAGRQAADHEKDNRAEDGFTLHSGEDAQGAWISVSGSSERGLLYGVGKLLRLIDFERLSARLATAPLQFESQPQYRLRGHQLGYRPKTNAYDGWTVPMWDQYIRDLAVFGVNAIELLPPHTDDLPDSPNFSLPPAEMMTRMSAIADSYGLDVWVWQPATERDYTDPATLARSLADWGSMFASLPRLDAVYVPGGDPGHTEPAVLLGLLEQQKKNLQTYHPSAQIWVSAQGFDAAWMEQFLALLNQPKTRQWLDGVVFGPMSRLSITELRDALHDAYPIRCYPDITHSMQCQYPVPDWDVAYALTESREVINPRPQDEAVILRHTLPSSIGFISYSEGCNDDVNKFVWSALAWEQQQPVIDVLRDFAHYFGGPRDAEGWAQGLLALEDNWRGPLATNGSVERTLLQFQDLEDSCSPQLLQNWRFQQALYRAYYDAFVRARLLAESAQVERARGVLAQVLELGWTPVPLDIGASPSPAPPNSLVPEPLLVQAQGILEESITTPIAPQLRTRVLELGAALFQSIHMQLAVERYAAEAVDRGANLDTLDTPVSDTMWMRRRVLTIRALTGANQQVAAIRQLLSRTDPGPGGFYDELGNPSNRPHLLTGTQYVEDPGYRTSVRLDFCLPDTLQDKAPVAWKAWAETLYDQPLVMQYAGLDGKAQYRLRVVHSGDSPGIKLRLVANDTVVIHPYQLRAWPPAPEEFTIPREATAHGSLKLAWNREPGRGGSGVGCQVAEVWLLCESTGAGG